MAKKRDKDSEIEVLERTAGRIIHIRVLANELEEMINARLTYARRAEAAAKGQAVPAIPAKD
jgi:hypothetical protein